MALCEKIINEIQDLHRTTIGEGRVPSYLATHLVMSKGPFRMIASGDSKVYILETLNMMMEEGYSKSDALQEMGIDALEFDWSLKYFCQIVEDITAKIVEGIPTGPDEPQKYLD